MRCRATTVRRGRRRDDHAPDEQGVLRPRPAAATLAAIGAATIIASPPGAIHRPAFSIDWPEPVSGLASAARAPAARSTTWRTSRNPRRSTRRSWSAPAAAPSCAGRRSATRRAAATHANTAKITSDATNRPSVVALVHPQLCPLVMPTAASPGRPPAGARPADRAGPTTPTGTDGTMNANSRRRPPPSPAANQNSACQLKCSAIAADNGNPSAPPTPSDALIKPIAVPTRSAGTDARSTLMPSGMMGSAKPLQSASDDERDQRAGGRRDQRSGGQQHGAGDQHRLGAVHVTEPAEHRRRDGRRQQRRRDRPRRIGCAGVQQLWQFGDQRDDQRLHQRHADTRRREHGDEDAGMHRGRTGGRFHGWRPTSYARRRMLHVSCARQNLLRTRHAVTTNARSAGTSSASARPRCDAASFSAALSSAAERSEPDGTKTGS